MTETTDRDAPAASVYEVTAVRGSIPILIGAGFAVVFGALFGQGSRISTKRAKVTRRDGKVVSIINPSVVDGQDIFALLDRDLQAMTAGEFADAWLPST